MASKRISELPAATALDGSEQIPLTQAGETRRIPSDIYSQVQKSALTVTVGTDAQGADYNTISAALADLSERHHVYRSGGFAVTVNILTGFTMAEMIHLEDVDLSWITITSDDAEVPIDRSTQSGDGAFRMDRASSPMFDCIFKMGTEGTSSTVKVFNAFFGSRLYLGTNGGARGACDRLVQLHSSFARLDTGSVIEDGTGLGLRAANASRIFGAGAIIRNNNDENMAIGSASVAQMDGATIAGSVTKSNVSISPGPVLLDVHNANLSGASTRGINASGAAFVDARDADMSGCGLQASSGSTVDAAGATTRVGASDDPSDTRVVTGGIIIAENVIGGVSQAPNVQTEDGLIIDSAATSDNDGRAIFSGDGAATDFDIAHGLTVGSPNVRQVTPASPDAAPTHHIARVDSSIIRVRYATAPPSGTDNVVLDWYARR